MVLFAVLVLSACAPAPVPPPPPPSVGIYGDSISFEASPWSDAAVAAAGMRVTGFRFPGLAACDLIEPVRADLARPQSLRPRVIVVSTIGNGFSNCMRGSDGLLPTDWAGLTASYEQSLRTIATLAESAGVPMVFTWGPTSSPFLPGWSGEGHVALAAARVASDHPGMTLSHVGAVVLDEQDRHAQFLDCRPDETAALGCVAGRVHIRPSDTDVHFYCPEPKVTAQGWPRPCPVESPGARRYGMELARVALERIEAEAARVSG